MGSSIKLRKIDFMSGSGKYLLNGMQSLFGVPARILGGGFSSDVGVADVSIPFPSHFGFGLPHLLRLLGCQNEKDLRSPVETLKMHCSIQTSQPTLSPFPFCYSQTFVFHQKVLFGLCRYLLIKIIIYIYVINVNYVPNHKERVSKRLLTKIFMIGWKISEAVNILGSFFVEFVHKYAQLLHNYVLVVGIINLFKKSPCNYIPNFWIIYCWFWMINSRK